MKLEVYYTVSKDVDIDIDKVIDTVLENFPIEDDNPSEADLMWVLDGFANDVYWYTKDQISMDDYALDEKQAVEGFGRALYKRYNRNVDEGFSFVEAIYSDI